MTSKVIFNAGQRKIYQECEPAIQFERSPYVKVEAVENIPPLVVHPAFQEKDYVANSDVTEMIPGVTAEQIDWFWANMEKGYSLWAPGEHYGFDWVVPPCEVGYEGSAEASYEFDTIHPTVVTRLGMQEYPFTECFEHCWLADGKLGPFDTILVHMYQDVPGGIYWRSVQVVTKDVADYMNSHPELVPENVYSHMKYEAGRFPVFLPTLYELWKDHPDPWQNVQYDLTTVRNEDGTWSHKKKNLPPQKEE